MVLYGKSPVVQKFLRGFRGAIIARNNTHTPSRCWIRTMLYVNGEWIVEPCADRWVKIPQLVISHEVPRQGQYDDTLPTASVFFRLMTKRWADVCLAVFEFCTSQILLPVGSSQFCSLFNWFPSADISEFLSSIALDRTVLRSVQSSQNSFSVAPSVQLSLDQHQSSSSSTDSSSSLHFDQTDVDATASSLPPASQDLSAALVDLHATLSEQIFEYQISWNDVVGMHSFVSADEVFNRYILEENQQFLSLSLEIAKRQPDGYSDLQPADDVNQQMLFKDSKTASLK
ncbi:hypothetical protein F511_44765 [Dorcoceras hygrometricum]|uniref:Uncharacterized protein n=1 Tax=Dorcoceras hygrometricum TaxID=472368 RepID=A0A2Z7BZS1_9LAMI|nr:hypothetical protein F511_44765 [Dorcoceras hygrometricum]